MKNTFRALLFGAALSLSPTVLFASQPIPVGSPMTSSQSQATTAYQVVLQKHLRPGPDGILQFDYAAAKAADHQTIKAFIAEQSAGRPSAMSRDHALAYWANLYNALTLDVVLDDYPMKTIRSFGLFNQGPWDQDAVTVEGETLTLNNIEHDIMRAKYPTPYIHYMVNCASVGCPNLRPALWQADTLDADMRDAAAAYINADRGIDVSGKTMSVSKIYKWYSEDFGSSEELRAHLVEHAQGDKRAAIQSARFKGSHYDWDLNDTK